MWSEFGEFGEDFSPGFYSDLKMWPSMKVVLVSALFCISAIQCKSQNGDLVVCPRGGCILGTVLPGHQRPYEAFLGVPYAKPPVGKLRFRSPLPAESWYPAIWNGTFSRSTCIQKIYASWITVSTGEEDCLYMNIYRPMRKKTRKHLPVIVLITGGGFSIGTGNNVDFSPDYIMNRKDIILVVLQHRLGVFGYLCSGTTASQGNFGLKDQQLALEWIRDNIETFGGNSQLVTLLGQGSGCAAVMMHMMNAKSCLLFHQVILQSGSLAHWALLKNPKSHFKRQARYAGILDYKSLTTKEIVSRLRKVDAEVLRESADRFKFWHFDHLVNYRPCIEKETWKDPFLTVNPYVAWANGTYYPKPILITFTPNDGTYRAPILTNDTLLGEFNAGLREILPKLLEFPSKYVDKVLKYYFDGDTPFIQSGNEHIFIKMISDRYFHQSLYNNVKQFRENVYTEKIPIHIYKFNFQSEFRYTKRTTNTDRDFGVGYRDDLLFMFRIPSRFPDIQLGSIEARMSDLYVRVLANFAAHGKKISWISHKKCTAEVDGFCNYQEFSKYSDSIKEEVLVKVSDEFRVDAAEFWNKIDEGK